mmetsp:Transcript_35283/g.53421  ORF Transcript_35283/g.53421 Transcript_35283/m.53421 type:complete len:296 (+) Transcript_35283:98-985(+)
MMNQNGINYILAVDKIRVMMHRETATYSCSGSYLNQVIGEDWRLKVCKWAYNVVDHFEFDRNAATMAISYLDRFMNSTYSSGLHVSKKCFQLSAIACILIAIKVEGRKKKGKQITIYTLADLSRGVFSAESIRKMEEGILSTLKWRVNPPIAAHFICDFIQLFPAYEGCCGVRALIYELSKYFADISVCVAKLAIDYKPSTVAFASITNALELIDSTSLPHTIRKSFLTNISDATNLKVESREVYNVRMLLRKTCPAIVISENTFYVQDSTMQDTDDLSNRGVSPACVSGVPSQC